MLARHGVVKPGKLGPWTDAWFAATVEGVVGLSEHRHVMSPLRRQICAERACQQRIFSFENNGRTFTMIKVSRKSDENLSYLLKGSART